MQNQDFAKSSIEIKSLHPYNVVKKLTKRKEPVVVNDYKKEERFRRSPLVKELDIECGCHVKIRGYNDVYGVMSKYSGDKSEFSKDDLNYVQIVTSLIGFSIERKKPKRVVEGKYTSNIYGQVIHKKEGEGRRELKREKPRLCLPVIILFTYKSLWVWNWKPRSNISIVPTVN